MKTLTNIINDNNVNYSKWKSVNYQNTHVVNKILNELDELGVVIDKNNKKPLIDKNDPRIADLGLDSNQDSRVNIYDDDIGLIENLDDSHSDHNNNTNKQSYKDIEVNNNANEKLFAD